MSELKKYFLILALLLIPASSFAVGPDVFMARQGGSGTSTNPTADQILIGGDTANRYDIKTLTAGSGITLATTSGKVTLSTSVGFSYPFTNTSYGGSTTTVLGFLGGLFSTASSTFNAPLFITNLSQGLLYNGTSGRTQSIATSSLTASGVLTLSQPISVVGSSASALTLTGGAGGQILGWLNGIPTWTATTTFSSPLVYSAGDVSCPTCGTGTVTSITGGTGLLGGTITTSGTLSLLSYIATSSAETAGQLSYWTSTNGTPATLGGIATSTATCTTGASCSSFTIVGAGGTTITTILGTSVDLASAEVTGTLPITNGGTNATSFTTTGNGVYWNGTSLLTAPLTSSVTYPYASTTAVSVAGSLAVTPLTSAITLTGADGTFAEYTGTTCTNQFARSLSALGVATCATVANTDLANSTISGVALGSNLAALTATDGSLTFSGSYDGSTARTVGLASIAANSVLGTYAAGVPTAIATSSLFQNASASLSGLLTSADWSTFNGKAGFAYLFPSNATTSTLTLEGGFVSSASSTFSSTLDLSNATVKQHTYSTFSLATSTAWTGTSTRQLGTTFVAETWKQAICRTTVGTLNVTFYNSNIKMNMISVTTASSTVAFTTNNSLPANTNIKVDIGTPASSPVEITCSIDRIINQ